MAAGAVWIAGIGTLLLLVAYMLSLWLRVDKMADANILHGDIDNEFGDARVRE